MMKWDEATAKLDEILSLLKKDEKPAIKTVCHWCGCMPCECHQQCPCGQYLEQPTYICKCGSTPSSRALEKRIQELEAKVEYLHRHVHFESFSPTTNPWSLP